MEQITNLVGSLGFPIVACIFMWKYINTTMREFSNMMQNNNDSINKLCDKIDGLILQLVGKKEGGDDEQ